jgi:hypothetical protein
MSTVELRSKIDGFLNQVDDSFLKVVHAMLETYVEEKQEEEEELTDEQIGAIVAAGDYKPMTKEALHAEIREGFEQIERGEYYTVEELEKDMEQW